MMKELLGTERAITEWTETKRKGASVIDWLNKRLRGGGLQNTLLMLLSGFRGSEFWKPGKPNPFDTSAVRMDVSHPISTEAP